MGKTSSVARRTQLILGASFSAATIVFLLVFYLTGTESEVAETYFPYADELVRGSIPQMEYPPFALMFIAIPRLFAGTTFGYEIAFAAEAFVFFMIGLIVTRKLAKRYCRNQNAMMLFYTVLMVLMVEFVLDRYDIFPAILTFLSFYCLVTKRYAYAFALLSIATMTKLYPAVLFPIYLIPFISNRDWSNTLRGAGAFFITAFVIVLPFLFFEPAAVFYFLSYHMDRPLQVESTAASFIAFASILGLTNTWVEFGFGSDNLMGPWSDAAASCLTSLIMFSVILIYVWYAYMLSKLRKEEHDNENNRIILMSGATLLSILAFIICGKVFSPQYMVWIIPFIVFILMTSIDRVSKRYIIGLSVAAILLTQLNYVVNMGISGGGDGITDLGMIIILARNIMVIVFFVYIMRKCGEHEKQSVARTAAVE